VAGNLARRVIRNGGILGQCIQGIFLPKIFEEVFLPPPIEHTIGHLGCRQIAP
jgi:hypothetical protein